MVMGQLGLMYEGSSARPVAMGPPRRMGLCQGICQFGYTQNTKGTEWSGADMGRPHTLRSMGVPAGLHQRGIYKDPN